MKSKYYLFLLLGVIASSMVAVYFALTISIREKETKRKTAPIIHNFTFSEAEVLNESLLHRGNFHYKTRCAGCHGMKGEGARDGIPLNTKKWKTLEELAEKIAVGNVEKGMPTWGNRLQTKDLKAITLFVKQGLNQSQHTYK